MISAPLSLMMSCGRIVLPSDLDIFLPSSSTTKPWVTTCAERRAAPRAQADEQRALEPAAVLIAALEVEVGRPRQLRAERQHRLVARTRVEPHVEDVALPLELRAAARRARQSVGDELLDRPFVPGVGAVDVEDPGGALDERRRQERLAALRAVDRRDRHAPGPLPRDAPVGTVRDHVRRGARGPRPAAIRRRARRCRARRRAGLAAETQRQLRRPS